MKPFANIISGEMVALGEVKPNINPSDTNDVVGEFACGGVKDAQDAVAAARAALPAWSRTTAQARADILAKAGAEILARKDELGQLLAREEGKTLPEATGEAARAGQILQFFAAEAMRLPGEKLPSMRPGIEVEVTREPVGVVGMITPWNFPIAIPAWKIAPALAFGNTVVLKPAELTPMLAWHLVDILNRAGLPKGVLNLVMGKGSVLGPAIIGGVDALTFTGSVPTGRAIAQQAIGRMLKIQMEMGGKNPMVVLDDADLDTAVNAAVNGAFFSTGQRCTASSRLIVTENIHDRFVEGVKKAMAAMTVDNALKPGVNMGPVVDERQLETDLRYLEIGDREGAKRSGGDRLNRETPGFYLSPALFTETHNDMRINREEIFGPVASVIRVKDYDEALAVANDTEFGLSSGICTTSLKHATHFKRNAEAGMVMVNTPTAGVDYHTPFGGRKASSYGSREQGRYAAEFYTTVKTAYVNA
ncbi:MAG TPA: aldehyde dehydrogenase family protein [Caulobacteraceae bacterium]|jgi:aldehyde dehydrogenase (NAD+)